MKARQTWANKAHRFLTEESGQGTVEYILILSVCVLGVTQMVKQLRGALDAATRIIGGALEKDLKTGRAPIGEWEN